MAAPAPPLSPPDFFQLKRVCQQERVTESNTEKNGAGLLPRVNVSEADRRSGASRSTEPSLPHFFGDKLVSNYCRPEMLKRSHSSRRRANLSMLLIAKLSISLSERMFILEFLTLLVLTPPVGQVGFLIVDACWGLTKCATS